MVKISGFPWIEGNIAPTEAVLNKNDVIGEPHFIRLSSRHKLHVPAILLQI